MNLNVDQGTEFGKVIVQVCNGVKTRRNILDKNLRRSAAAVTVASAAPTATSTTTTESFVIKPFVGGITSTTACLFIAALSWNCVLGRSGIPRRWQM